MAALVSTISSSVTRHGRRKILLPLLPKPISITNPPQLLRPSPSIRHYSFDGSPNTPADPSTLELSRWPITKANTILNIVPQGKMFVVERLGKMHDIQPSGYFFAIPYVDQIAYVVDVRERALDIRPQAAITRDNVSVEVSGNLFLRVEDVERAAYGARNPMYSVMQNAQSAMRSAIGEMELDEILHNRTKLNTLIKTSLQSAASAWGLLITRYEITEITPDEQIRVAMDKQAAAERDKREQILRAEGDKRRAELVSEGVKISLVNESEGALIRVRNEAEASKVKMVKEAEGSAESVRVRAEAEAKALGVVAEALGGERGAEAARLALAKAYVDMYGEMGKSSNTMFFNGGGGGGPADVASLLVQAGAALGALPEGGKKVLPAGNDEVKAISK